MNIKEALQFGKDKGIDPGECLILLSFTLGVDKTFLYAHPERTVTEKETEEYVKRIRRRQKHEPIAYILKEKEFFGLPLKVTPDVLIPRQDTECLVEEALNYLNGDEDVLDLCTGSGAIGIAIKSRREKINLTLSDKSEKALEVTRENLNRFGMKAEVVKSDLFESVKGEFDLVISNPPYISENDYCELPADVRDYEPREALIAGDGLYYYRRIIGEAKKVLRRNGLLIVEIGYNQGIPVAELFRREGFADTAIKRDLGDLNRMVTGKKG